MELVRSREGAEAAEAGEPLAAPQGRRSARGRQGAGRRVRRRVRAEASRRLGVCGEEGAAVRGAAGWGA